MLALAACLAWFGATSAPDAPPSPAPSARCKDAAEPLERYQTAAGDPDETFAAVAPALDVSQAYDRCAAFAAARGNAEDLHDMQVRAAYYRYVAGRIFFIAEDYSQAREQLDDARKLVADTIAWTEAAANEVPGSRRESRYRPAALTVRDAANALLAKIPVPTGISTAPATTPATGEPK